MTDYIGDPLRVLTFDDFVGQREMKERLAVHIEAAVADERTLDHVLLAGPPGFGKTSLARIIARELNDTFDELKMPVKPQAFASYFRQWEGGVLLLDEIHRLSQSGQEDLLPVLEEGYFATATGQRIAVHWTTIIGATTEPEKVIKPLYDRFVHRPSLVDYVPSELARITKGMAAKLELDLPDDLCEQLGKATGGTPRNARTLVMAARDLQQIGRDVTFEAVLDLAGMEKDGLNVAQVEYLRVLNGLGGKAGLTTLGAMLRLHPSVITDLERLLLKLRLIQYTAGGRELTNAGYEKANGAPVPIRRRRTA